MGTSGRKATGPKWESMIVWKAIAGLVLMAAVLVLSVLAAFEWAVEGDRHGVRMGQGEDTPDRSLTSGFFSGILYLPSFRNLSTDPMWVEESRGR